MISAPIFSISHKTQNTPSRRMMQTEAVMVDHIEVKVSSNGAAALRVKLSSVFPVSVFGMLYKKSKFMC